MFTGRPPKDTVIYWTKMRGSPARVLTWPVLLQVVWILLIPQTAPVRACTTVNEELSVCFAADSSETMVVRCPGAALIAVQAAGYAVSSTPYCPSRRQPHACVAADLYTEVHQSCRYRNACSLRVNQLPRGALTNCTGGGPAGRAGYVYVQYRCRPTEPQQLGLAGRRLVYGSYVQLSSPPGSPARHNSTAHCTLNLYGGSQVQLTVLQLMRRRDQRTVNDSVCDQRVLVEQVLPVEHTGMGAHTHALCNRGDEPLLLSTCGTKSRTYRLTYVTMDTDVTTELIIAIESSYRINFTMECGIPVGGEATAQEPPTTGGHIPDMGTSTPAETTQIITTATSHSHSIHVGWFMHNICRFVASYILLYYTSIAFQIWNNM